MTNSGGRYLSGFTIKMTRRGFSAECKTCFYVSETGAYRPTSAKFGKHHARMLQWAADHEHTEYLSLETAKKQGHQNWLAKHPDELIFRETRRVMEMAQNRIQMDRIEELSEDLIKRERCYICGAFPERVQVRNDTREPGVLALVVCVEHTVITEEMWRKALIVAGYRIPKMTK